MYALGVLTILLRAPSRRAYNMSHYKQLPSYFLFLARTNFAPQRTLAGLPPAATAANTIIIRHAPRLQGKTVNRLLQPQRKFSNVASAHHFLCLLGSDLHDRLGGLATER